MFSLSALRETIMANKERNASHNEIVPRNFPRNFIFKFGGHRVKPFGPSPHAMALRSRARRQIPPPADESGEPYDNDTEHAYSPAWWVEFHGLGPGQFKGPQAVETLQSFFHHAETPHRVLSLVLGGDIGTGQEARIGIECLVRFRRRLPGLKALFLGEIDDDCVSAHMQEAPIGPLLAAFPGLEVLSLCVPGAVRFRGMVEHGLKELTLYDNALHPVVLNGLVACSFPQLTRLELFVSAGSRPEGNAAAADREREALFRLFNSPNLPSLQRLGLRGIPSADYVIEALAKSNILRQLRCLDLSRSAVTVYGLHTILVEPLFRNLDRMVMTRRLLPEDEAFKFYNSLYRLGVIVVFADPL